MNDTISIEDCGVITDTLSEDFENMFVVIAGVAAATFHGLLLILFSDRLAGVKHRGTKLWFCVTICFDILNSVNYAIGNAIPWYFENAGSNLYFYTGTVAIVFYNTSMTMLQFQRVKSSLLTSFGRTVQFALYIPIVVQFFLELANQLYGAILFSVTLDQDQSLYIVWLLWLTLGYRFLLDGLMGGYSMWIVYSASKDMDKALAFAYVGRMMVFLVIDALEGLSLNFNTLDAEFSHFVIFFMPRLLIPFKPYILLTDAGRIRLLADTMAKKVDKDGTSVTGGSSAGPRSSVGPMRKLAAGLTSVEQGTMLSKSMPMDSEEGET
ncbi:hypothetical protein HKX48_008908 [Thoreauomyces humboldtii]|nr:hypothetical protein HKX48_008908 [Thoreauomyces humboldtii]